MWKKAKFIDHSDNTEIASLTIQQLKIQRFSIIYHMMKKRSKSSYLRGRNQKTHDSTELYRSEQ